LIKLKSPSPLRGTPPGWARARWPCPAGVCLPVHARRRAPPRGRPGPEA